MFTWICPQCGREVPPAYTECPDCNPQEGAKPPAAPPADVMSPSGPVAAPPPPEPTPVAPPPPAPAPPPRPPAPPADTVTPPSATPRNSAIFNTQVAPAPRRSGLPTWLMAVLFAGGFVIVGLGIYWLISSKSTSTAVALSKPSANVESPAAKPGVMHPLQKHIEIAGVRFVEGANKNKKNPIAVAFLVINHSNLDIDGLAGNVTLWSNTRRSDEDAQGTFSFTTDIKANSARELTVPLNTTKQAVELPDWQYLSPDVQITGPAFAGGSVVQK